MSVVHLVNQSLIFSPLAVAQISTTTTTNVFKPPIHITQSRTDIIELPQDDLMLSMTQIMQSKPEYTAHVHTYPSSKQLSETKALVTICDLTATPHSEMSEMSSISSLSTPMSDSSFELGNSIPMAQLLFSLTNVAEEIIFAQHGYKKIGKIKDTMQGELFEAIHKEKDMKVLIKKCDKLLVYEHISFADSDDMHFCIDDDVRKEAQILNYISSDYIVKYIDFFESSEAFYLVTEYIHDCINLKQFVKKAHDYIRNGQLKVKDYQKVVKFICWQICCILHWLHQHMHCCHLNLSMEAVIVENAEFIQHSDGSVIINPSIIVKFTDLSKAEVFSPNDDKFRCMKSEIENEPQYVSPEIRSEEIYDARKADMWCLGMILYNLVIGEPLFKEISMFEIVEPIQGSGYWSAMTNNIVKYLSVNNLLKYTNSKMLRIIKDLLNTDESERLNALEALQTSWFKYYYRRYFSQRVHKKQLESQRQQQHMQTFDYYVCLY